MNDSRRALIITADDFGLHPSVNEAVETAHRDGVLAAASLMVAAPFAADAIERARRLPGLRVGLHLVLVDGSALLAPRDIPALVRGDGRFHDNMLGAGLLFYLRRSVQRQLAAEIRAQFSAFAATGLTLDHVNTHKHFHLHPTVLDLILEIGPAFGMRAVRLPQAIRPQLLLRPWLARVRARLDAAGIRHNDYIVGLDESGRFDESTLLAALRGLPDGIGELYLHPGARSGSTISASMSGYRHEDELAALLSPAVRGVLEQLQLVPGGFADLEVAR